MTLPSAARLTIDLDALAHNYRVLRAQAGEVVAAPVLKGDGYGLGVGPIARRLWAEGARQFFVARLSEGEILRSELGAERPATLYVLDGMTEGTGDRLVASGLTPALTSLGQVHTARTYQARSGATLPVALHIDTGMNRQGLLPAEALGLGSHDFGGLELKLVMSHLGSATAPGDPRNALQLQRFKEVRSHFADVPASLSASAGIFLGKAWRYEVVRPGVSLFGGGPEEVPDVRLQAVATLTAPILDIRTIPAGEWLGYGSRLVLDRSTRVAVVAAGYADGVIRAARSAAFGWYGGARRKILIVNMDLIVIDIGDARAEIGDAVELMGPNAPIDELATAAGTVAHECLVRLSPRAERVYLGGT